ncbi:MULTISPECIES: exodeoxyribonuclease V subunit beta [Proteus]|uniref:exodeoxyribonuclease V subunit beta n=1 Tax=Proteus TaxID=583 RepID=UPI000D6E0F4D|nr:exodeoxyribonuclease V subunit beta [Proteus sp. CA142267]MBJ2109671.1 exodeoxyribonuclease V subunit beta [Proteus terrae]MBJ2133615.1 exodeoxyribonuclease V subunit beta [Proteus terrae]MCO7048411.1 exodeoxyribonuclease V subunit beta [Proteus terrae]MCS6712926.1 exodeoxyribonuclease V subunit beta [Proteus terrae]MCS6731327.1 exodeoxyribonuclease V subunit beta [Proteus terrae]
MSEVIQAQPLNPYTLPLYQRRLIEASAGTGKTYTIGLLYLRLLLGLGGESAFYRPLSVEEILVVTFTDAATDELRARIRKNIHELRLACIRHDVESSDNTYLELLKQIPNKELAAQWLLEAERQMDEAAIYTIHGFCQRMLANNAFESGVLFEQVLIQDEYELKKRVCADFWRRHCYPLSYDVANAVSQIWSGPEQLLYEIQPYLQGEMPEIEGVALDSENESVKERHQAVIEAINNVKTRWNEHHHEVEAWITASGVDKRSYSSRFLPKWIEEITLWASTLETKSYQLPDCLARFSQETLNEKATKGPAPEHILFVEIERLTKQSLTLRDVILVNAIPEIRQGIENEKMRRGEMGFDDLLTRLDRALKREGGEALAQAIRERYPVAMIDEFQDTDPQQYRIFDAIYGEHENSGLLFIGDPKQAIYAFRGADIFTYIQARKQTSHHYTLNTNWRSAPGMVNAVNKLFMRSNAPFLFEHIPFIEVSSAEKNQDMAFIYHDKPIPPFNFWLAEGESVSTGNYEQIMAAQCAAQIRDWLSAGDQQQAWLIEQGTKKSVTSADIMVLVRSRREAVLIRDALNLLSIQSVFLSNRESVFETNEAKDLLWLLQAVVTPEKERVLRASLASQLFGFSAKQIDDLNCSEERWNSYVEKFADYYVLWQKRGVLPMLRKIMMDNQIAENLLASIDGERRLTDIMHIGELLQETSLQLDSEHALIRWLAQQISHPDAQSESQQMRLESDRNLVRICTIHKSKGLEYPIVCLPFACNYQEQKGALYHDRDKFYAKLDIFSRPESLRLADEERLAEDLRLLYVALTRSKFCCYVGVAPLVKGTKRKSGLTDLHKNALGYLLQQGEEGNSELLHQSIHALLDDNISVTTLDNMSAHRYQPQLMAETKLEAAIFKRQIQDNWRITSYSGLTYQHSNRSYHFDLGDIEALVQSIAPRLDTDAKGEKQQGEVDENSIHHFPRGAVAGTFLHSLLEVLDFSQPVDELWMQGQLTAQGFDEKWAPLLVLWMETLFHTPLNPQGLCLADIPKSQQLDELQFYLPIEKEISSAQLTQLISQFDPLSKCCPALQFQQVEGMLKGFIDLVFSWEGKYYVVDYKSNWLGESSEDYTQEAMMNAMMDHRYDLQYQLYTLALHRFLQQRIPDYDYQNHFGGIYYLFLRGIDKAHPGNGVYAYLPDEAFVLALDSLFAGKSSKLDVVSEK